MWAAASCPWRTFLALLLANHGWRLGQDLIVWSKVLHRLRADGSRRLEAGTSLTWQPPERTHSLQLCPGAGPVWEGGRPGSMLTCFSVCLHLVQILAGSLPAIYATGQDALNRLSQTLPAAALPHRPTPPQRTATTWRSALPHCLPVPYHYLPDFVLPFCWINAYHIPNPFYAN